MLPGGTNHLAGVFSSPELSPSAISAGVEAVDEDNLFGVGADDTFFSIYGLASTPPPATSAALWPSSSYPGSFHLSEPISSITTSTTAPTVATAKDALCASSSFSFDGPHASQDRLSPLLGSSIPSSLHLPRSTPDPTSGAGLTTAADASAMETEAAEAGTMHQHTDPNASHLARPMGSSKPRVMGVTRKVRKPKGKASNTTTLHEGDPHDLGPDTKVCLLAVGTKHKQHIARMDGKSDSGSSSRASNSSIAAADSARTLRDIVNLLTVEIDRSGRETETDYVESGQRAVLQVEALARFDLRYRIVVLEVEESLAVTTTTARELRMANPLTPIVAVAAPHVLQSTPQRELQSEGWRYFSEILEFPVSASTVRGLATRWLLGPPEHAVVEARAGMTGVSPPLGTPVEASAEAGMVLRQSQDAMSSGSVSDTATLASSLLEVEPGRGGGPSQGLSLQQQQEQVGGQGGLLNGEIWGFPSGAVGGETAPSPASHTLSLCTGRTLEGLDPPRSSLASLSSGAKIGNDDGSMVSRKQARVFGGTPEDRASPCRLFGKEFEKQNAEMEEMEFDFMFRHGTIVLRVEEDKSGKIVSEVSSACEYAMAHFGDLTGKPLESLFEFPATNKTTAERIVRHIEKSDTDSMCSYINLRSEVRWVTSSFVSVRSLSRRPRKRPGRERLPPWYVLFKVCLPSTLGLIKEPELLESMYSKKASDATKVTSRKARSKAASKRSAKKTKTASAQAEDKNDSGASGETSS